MAEGVTLTGRRKAAMLCVSLGPVAAAEIFKHLGQEALEALTVEMAKTPTVEPDAANRIFGEVIDMATARSFVAEGGLRYARDVLERALGAGRADEILKRLASMIEQTPFEFLRGIPPDQVFTFVRNESPQTIALILANLPTTELSAQVMQQLPPELQADVATRIALMGQTSPEVIKDIARVMEQKLESVLYHDYAASGGAQAIAEILNSADRATERNILEALTRDNPELAEEVRKLLFVFEDILKLDDRSIQLVLKEVDTKDLALALRGASDEVKERILGNMSQRGGEMLQEEMEYMPPQRRRVVEEAQSKIVSVVRRLEDAGSLVLARGSEDDELIA